MNTNINSIDTLSDTADSYQYFSRQASFEHSPKEDSIHIQSLSVSHNEEVGIFSESINCIKVLSWFLVIGCKWSKDGHRFAAGGGERILSVYNYDAETQKSELFSSYTCNSELLCLDWGYEKEANSDYQNLIVYGTQEGGVGVLNTIRNKAYRETILDGVSSVISVHFSPLMNSYCSSVISKNSSLLVWDLATHNCLLDTVIGSTSSHVNCVEYIPTGNGVFCGCSDGHVRLFDIRSGRVVADELIASEPISGLKLVLNTPSDGSASLFTCSVDGLLREHDFRNLSNISFFSIIYSFVIFLYYISIMSISFTKEC